MVNVIQFALAKSEHLRQLLGGYSQNCLHKFVKISITLGLNILSFEDFKCFLNQISLEVDITYIISSKIPIFDVKLALSSMLKLQRFYEFA